MLPETRMLGQRDRVSDGHGDAGDGDGGSGDVVDGGGDVEDDTLRQWLGPSEHSVPQRHDHKNKTQALGRRAVCRGLFWGWKFCLKQG